MTTAEFKNDSPLDLPEGGRLGWEAPSNIALVKYWGKHGMQLPANPSISFTLSQAKTTTVLSFEKKQKAGAGYDVHFSFEGEAKPDFEPKVLWWDGGDLTKPLTTYCMVVQVFGAGPSGYNANTALRRCADDGIGCLKLEKS